MGYPSVSIRSSTHSGSSPNRARSITRDRGVVIPRVERKSPVACLSTVSTRASLGAPIHAISLLSSSLRNIQSSPHAPWIIGNTR